MLCFLRREVCVDIAATDTNLSYQSAGSIYFVIEPGEDFIAISAHH